LYKLSRMGKTKYHKHGCGLRVMVAMITAQVISTNSLASAKNISIRAEWLHQSRRTLSEPSETPSWLMTPRPVSMPRVALHIALRSLFWCFVSLCWSPNFNKHTGIVANCDHTPECVHWVQACIGIPMQWDAAKISHGVPSTSSSRSVGRSEDMKRPRLEDPHN
jgi:hypothetical protein